MTRGRTAFYPRTRIPSSRIWYASACRDILSIVAARFWFPIGVAADGAGHRHTVQAKPAAPVIVTKRHGRGWCGAGAMHAALTGRCGYVGALGPADGLQRGSTLMWWGDDADLERVSNELVWDRR